MQKSTENQRASAWMLSMVVRRAVLVLGVLLLLPRSSQADLWEYLNPQLTSLRDQSTRLTTELQSFGKMTLGETTQQSGSQFHMAPTEPTVAPWVQLDLGYSQTFESILIAPVIAPGESGDFKAYAFPRGLRVDVSEDENFATFQPVSTFADTTFEAQQGLPVVVRTPNTKARYVRVSVTQLAEVAERWTYALGEIMVLSGNRNIALHSKVDMPIAPRLPPKWHPDYLVDCRTPLGAPIEIDLPEFDGVYCAPDSATSPNWMMLDLGDIQSIDEIRLHPIHARQGAAVAGYGFPKRFRVELFTNEDLTDSVEVFNSQDVPFPSPGSNPVVLKVSNVAARFVKITCMEPSIVDRGRFGLSEIQVYSADTNVASEATVIIPGEHIDRSPQLLVDGYASYGRILELPEWVDRWDRYRQTRLALRRNAVDQDSAINVAQSRARAIAFGSIVLGGGGGLMWIVRRRRRQQLERQRFRTRLAQDLHDEIGSNLAAIARLGEVAELETEPSQIAADWQSIRQLALECTDSMRETLWLLGGTTHHAGDLPARLRRAADRMLPDMQLAWHQDQDLPGFDQNKELTRELFLIFKEIIANVAKHSKASEVNVSLTYSEPTFAMSVRDNGVGFLESLSSGMGLSNIRERTNKFGGTAEIESAVNSGTCIEVKLPIRKR